MKTAGTLAVMVITAAIGIVGTAACEGTTPVPEPTTQADCERLGGTWYPGALGNAVARYTPRPRSTSAPRRVVQQPAAPRVTTKTAKSAKRHSRVGEFVEDVIEPSCDGYDGEATR